MRLTTHKDLFRDRVQSEKPNHKDVFMQHICEAHSQAHKLVSVTEQERYLTALV